MDLLADFLHFGASVFLLHVGLEQCEVWGVKIAVWIVQCEGSSGKWEVWSVKEAVGSEKCEVWSVKFKFGVRSAQCEVWSVRFGVWRKQWEVRSVKCGLWSAKCEVWSVECEVSSSECEESSVKCGVWRLCFVSRWKIKRLSREGHGRDRVSLNYRSFMFGKLPPPACPGLCNIMITWHDQRCLSWLKDLLDAKLQPSALWEEFVNLAKGCLTAPSPHRPFALPHRPSQAVGCPNFSEI